MGRAISHHSDLHVSGKIDNTLYERGGEPGSKGARLRSCDEHLGHPVESREIDNRLRDIGALENARIDAERAREVQVALQIQSILVCQVAKIDVFGDEHGKAVRPKIVGNSPPSTN